MIFALVFIVTWLILLLRYPRHALPLLLLAVVGMALLTAAVVWQEQRLSAQLNALSLELSYNEQDCPLSSPLALKLTNTSQHPLTELGFKVSAFAPKVSANLIQSGYAQYRVPFAQALAPAQSMTTCLALPALRPGYSASTVQFVATQRQGRFE